MATQEFYVRSGALTLTLDKEGKQVQRFKRGDKVQLNPAFNDIERLKSLGAIGGKDDAPLTPAQFAAAARSTNQGNASAPEISDGSEGTTDEAAAQAARLAAEEQAQAEADAAANAAAGNAPDPNATSTQQPGGNTKSRS